MSNAVWLNWSEITALSTQRRIVCWGKGEWFSKALPYLPVPPAYIVDNNPNDHGGQFEGARIDAPSRLWAEPRGSVFVVVTSTGFVAIADELAAQGFVPGRDFCVTPTLRDYAVIVAVREHPGVVYFTVSDPPRDDPQTGGGLYRYDLRARRYDKVVPGQPHGIVQGRGELAYLVDDSVGGIRVLDGQLQTLGALPLPHQSRPHGIGYCPKRHRLYVVMPPLDAIGVLDADTGERLALFDPKTRAQALFIDPVLAASAPAALVESASLNALAMAVAELGSIAERRTSRHAPDIAGMSSTACSGSASITSRIS